MNKAVAHGVAAVSSQASPSKPVSLRGDAKGLLSSKALQPVPSVLSFGSPVFDRALPQGLPAGAHEMAGEGAFAFSLMLLARALEGPSQGRGLVVQTGDATRETGLAYAPGLRALGLDPDRLGFAWMRTGAEALRVVDEALRSGAVAAIAAELEHEPRLDLSITRRFNLSGGATKAAAFLSLRDLSATSAALTRWRAEPAPSRGPRSRLLGRPALALSLLRNRAGPTGEWTLEWDSDDRVFHPARRYLHLWLPRLSIDRTRRARPELPSPMALIAKQASALRLTALDPAAQAEGLTVGLSLADARAQVPRLAVVDADEAADRAALKGLAEACRRYTPSLAVDPPDGVCLNVTGSERLFGGEAALARSVAAHMRRLGFEARCGLADTPALAWALARFAPDPAAPPGAGEAALASLPMAALRLEDETLSMLRGLGLRQVGQILDARVRPSLARRLGEAVLERLDQALGRRASPLALKLERSPYVTEQRLAQPVADEPQVLRLAADLARPLCTRLDAERLGARLFVLELWRVDGAVKRLQAPASRPLRDPERVAALFAERVAALNEGLEADFGFELLRLFARRIQPAAPQARDLLQEGPDSAGFAALIDRLSARLGEGTVRASNPVPETRVPERAVRTAPFDAAAPPAWNQEPAASDAGVALRPLTLFARPQPIEVTAVVPEGAPDRFRWRRIQRRIVAAEGPERLEPEWGRAGELPRVRDYYRLEDEGGRRYWVFREGRYGDPAEPRWFIHGLFA